MYTSIRSGWLPFVLGLLVMILLVNVTSSQQGAPRRYIGPSSTGGGPAFSQGVLVGDTLYISGRVAAVTTGPDELEKSIRGMLDGIQDVVKSAGMTMDDVVWMQVFCPDLTLYDKFNGIYRTYFSGPLPARAFVGSAPLLNQGHFEAMGIAVRR
jgi:2-iminobutanoate/2-iminopropanoate deaminase